MWESIRRPPGKRKRWGSADWMPRNLYERVEVMFRLKDRALCQQVCSTILASYLADTEKARLLRPDGTYVRARKVHSLNGTRHASGFSVQRYLMGLAESGDGTGHDHDAAHLLKLRHSPVMDVLSQSWAPEHNP